MPDHGIVVVGASAGGVEALVELAASPPGDLPPAVFVGLVELPGCDPLAHGAHPTCPVS